MRVLLHTAPGMESPDRSRARPAGTAPSRRLSRMGVTNGRSVERGLRSVSWAHANRTDDFTSIEIDNVAPSRYRHDVLGHEHCLSYNTKEEMT